MPSPFPGMDPYLEGYLFHDVHQRLASAISEQLAPLIAPRYVARLATYYQVISQDESAALGMVYRDVDVSEVGRRASGVVLGEAAIAYEIRQETQAPLWQAPLVMRITPVRTKLVRVLIREAKGNRLITAIEVLSPANKYMPGLKRYVQKRKAYLASNVNLLEIDLLRRGARPVSRELLPPTPYFVFLSRAVNRRQVEVWPIRLADPLPVVATPLRPEDGDAPLDLGAAFSVIYERARYDLSIDYRSQPVPPLVGDDAVWAADRLRHQGISTGSSAER